MRPIKYELRNVTYFDKSNEKQWSSKARRSQRLGSRVVGRGERARMEEKESRDLSEFPFIKDANNEQDIPFIGGTSEKGETSRQVNCSESFYYHAHESVNHTVLQNNGLINKFRVAGDVIYFNNLYHVSIRNEQMLLKTTRRICNESRKLTGTELALISC